jgi:hypothetical protein
MLIRGLHALYPSDVLKERGGEGNGGKERGVGEWKGSEREEREGGERIGKRRKEGIRMRGKKSLFGTVKLSKAQYRTGQK